MTCIHRQKRAHLQRNGSPGSPSVWLPGKTKGKNRYMSLCIMYLLYMQMGHSSLLTTKQMFLSPKVLSKKKKKNDSKLRFSFCFSYFLWATKQCRFRTHKRNYISITKGTVKQSELDQRKAEAVGTYNLPRRQRKRPTSPDAR
jgi:hypothetical protein